MTDLRLERWKRAFWRSFFRLVVFTGALAEWACAAWVLVVMLGLEVPWAVHLAAPLLLHAFNRRLFGGPRPAAAAAMRHSPWRRAYVGVVFTSLFGFGALLINGAGWVLVAAVLRAVSGLGAPVAAADVLGAAGTTGSIALVLVSSMIAWGYGPGQRHVRIVDLEVAIDGLPPCFDGFCLAQLSDIHLGGYMDDAALASHVARTNALGADLICITGDITDGLDHAPRTFPILAGLDAPCGVVAILGNHDFYTGADAVTEELRRRTGFCVLRDDALVIEREGRRLHVLGVDDAGLDWTRGVREHEALPPLVARVPRGEATVLLSHRPDLFAQAAGFGIGLVLSGHTHGGQLALPWPSARPASLAGFISDFPRGTYRLGDSTLHVNLGLGVTGQPVRLFSPREITRITLRRPTTTNQA
jgi:predicted MPP superfamily phosphohydrolase